VRAVSAQRLRTFRIGIFPRSLLHRGSGFQPIINPVFIGIDNALKFSMAMREEPTTNSNGDPS